MRRLRKLRLAAALALAVTAVVILAAGLGSVDLQAGRPFTLQRLEEVRQEVGITTTGRASWFESIGRLMVLTIIWMVLPLVLVYVLVSPDARRAFLKRVARWSMITLFIYLVTRIIADQGGFAGIQPPPCAPAGTAGPAIQAAATAAPPCTGDELTEAIEPQPVPDFVSRPPEWIATVISLMLAAAIVAIAWWIIRRARPAGEPEQAEALVAEAETALADLRAGGDLRDTVMRCYSEMSEVIGHRRGLARHASMTPREFEQFLAGAGLRDEHIQRLTRLFEAVRYGGRATGERDRREAIDCLAAIVRDHGRPA
jgi:hypothetical protein